MNKHSLTKGYAALWIIIFIFSSNAWAQNDLLGQINHKFSGTEVAMPYFEKGLLLLHNFEYEDAAREFDMAQLLDPDLVMAFWGEAMCYNQALWFQQDYAKGRGALMKLAVKSDDRVSKAATELEKEFLSAIEMLYGEDTDVHVRNEKYEQAMAAMYEKYPDDEEVAAFYALAILGNCPEGYVQQKYDLASRVLVKLNAANPEHPGALNYLIHLNDDPSRAYKARKAAETYSQIATHSRYALHAPSHIYLATGDWAKMTAGNEASWKLSEATVKKKKLGLEDRDYHVLWWLQYGYLQQGKYAKALELLNGLHHDSRYIKSERIRFHLAMMRAHYLVESGKWLSDVTRIEIPTNGFSVSVKNMCFFVDAMAALEKHDLPRVDWYLNQMTDQRMVEKNKKEAFRNFRICGMHPIESLEGLEEELTLAEVMEWNIQALKAMKTSKLEEAEGFVKKAVELEDKTKYHPGAPVVVKPAHEIYGELLMEMHNYAKAVEQFDLALQRAPGRSLSLLGKYKALINLGDTRKAAEVKELLMNNWKNADEQALVLIN